MPRHELNPWTRSRAAPDGAPAVDVIVLTADLEMFMMLQDAAEPGHVLWHAPTSGHAVDLLLGGHCGVLIADLEELGSEAASLLEQLQQQFPELVLLAMGRREQEKTAIGPLVTSGRVYRFIHKPLSPARAQVFISTAARRYIGSSTTPSPARAAVKQLTQPAHRATYAGVLSALVVLAGLWWQQDALKRIAKSFVPPPRVIQQATPPEVNPLEQQLVTALQARDTPRAATLFSALQKADPENPRLPAFREQLLALSRGVR